MVRDCRHSTGDQSSQPVPVRCSQPVSPLQPVKGVESHRLFDYSAGNITAFISIAVSSPLRALTYSPSPLSRHFDRQITRPIGFYSLVEKCEIWGSKGAEIWGSDMTITQEL
ncbi:hypothetical protein AB205_0154720 [Aquarana catesbeiana]|uniref:Uncharacterized protein n=1 Tax=Aquarana catesbeiana TaxID=8400 RepID=A0A2G9R681_AQUCT|nr:hypothetical protein AB205_0154720 [Aquarana catesbeiana]